MFCDEYSNLDLPLYDIQNLDMWLKKRNPRWRQYHEVRQENRSVMEINEKVRRAYFRRGIYCIGKWKVRSMNQGKSNVIKQEMARVNINILGSGELKWMGMGQFNSNDHYIYYCWQEHLRRNGVALIVNKSPTCSTCVPSQKTQNDLHSYPR